MTNNYFSTPSSPSTNFLNPIYNISQLLKLSQFFSHPTNYNQLHTKQLSFNYIITLNNQLQYKHHQSINQFLTSSIQNNNFSPPPLTLSLYNPQTNSYQSSTPQPLSPQPIQPQPQPIQTQPTTPPPQPIQPQSQPTETPQQIPTSPPHPSL